MVKYDFIILLSLVTVSIDFVNSVLELRSMPHLREEEGDQEGVEIVAHGGIEGFPPG